MYKKNYTLKNQKNINYFTSDLLAENNIIHGFSTRSGNHRDDFSLGSDCQLRDQNRRDFCSAVGVDSDRLVYLKQIHSDKIIVFDQIPDTPPCADAAVTKQPGIALAAQTADCVPVLIADPENKVIAAVHAGWRGTVAGILGKTLTKMFELGAKPEKCLVVVGPCIGQCCYQVDNLVIDQFAAAAFPWQSYVDNANDGLWDLDLAGINIRQALDAGVPAQQISHLDLCTSCNHEHFFSYRREGKTGRMMNIIALSGA